MAQRTIPRPVNPFLPPELFNPAPIGAQPGMMQPMQPPAMPQGAPPRRVPTTIEPMQGLGPMGAPQAAAASAMPMPGAPQGGGFMATAKGGLNDFLGSDASLAMAAGLLGGGSTSQAIGRGFAGAANAMGPERDRQRETQKANQTAEYFRKMGREDLAQMAQMGFAKEAFAEMTSGNDAPDLETMYDEETGMEYKARWNPNTKSWERVGGLKSKMNDLTVTDKKAILEADEAVMAGENVISALDEAIALNDEAYSGAFAESRGYGASLFGGDAGVATEKIKQIVTSNALESLKLIFGGMPTEGERKILLEIQGSVNQAPEVRKDIWMRAKALAQRRIDFNRARADELRGGTFYRQDGGGAPPAPVPGALDPAIEDLVRTYGG